MEEVDVFVREKDMGRLILDNLFSESTEKFFNNCSFTSDRQAFMQGMNYAALLCSAMLEKYPVVVREKKESDKNG